MERSGRETEMLTDKDRKKKLKERATGTQKITKMQKKCPESPHPDENPSTSGSSTISAATTKVLTNRGGKGLFQPSVSSSSQFSSNSGYLKKGVDAPYAEHCGRRDRLVIDVVRAIILRQCVQQDIHCWKKLCLAKRGYRCLVLWMHRTMDCNTEGGKGVCM